MGSYQQLLDPQGHKTEDMMLLPVKVAGELHGTSMEN